MLPTTVVRGISLHSFSAIPSPLGPSSRTVLATMSMSELPRSRLMPITSLYVLTSTADMLISLLNMRRCAPSAAGMVSATLRACEPARGAFMAITFDSNTAP